MKEYLTVKFCNIDRTHANCGYVSYMDFNLICTGENEVSLCSHQKTEKYQIVSQDNTKKVKKEEKLTKGKTLTGHPLLKSCPECKTELLGDGHRTEWCPSNDCEYVKVHPPEEATLSPILDKLEEDQLQGKAHQFLEDQGVTSMRDVYAIAIIEHWMVEFAQQLNKESHNENKH